MLERNSSNALGHQHARGFNLQRGSLLAVGCGPTFFDYADAIACNKRCRWDAAKLGANARLDVLRGAVDRARLFAEFTALAIVPKRFGDRMGSAEACRHLDFGKEGIVMVTSGNHGLPRNRIAAQNISTGATFC
ncbi:hypothetical protein [Sphingobium vermicomposti]|uniref:Uncharacterized protein n=1 Tax=Sphingobium vermicomposti TaxID=529005 RepID=A0A846MEN4_9SPHN|nr:hypothetical protein [Sphingobium vermicomposti]NIJ16275.1 hypothetical protein [Sphingobium vermicomposti]